MKKQRGIMYQVVGTTDYAIGYHDEQYPQFKEQLKVYVHLFTDIHCVEPKKDGDDKEIAVLKDVSRLKVIGFTD